MNKTRRPVIFAGILLLIVAVGCTPVPEQDREPPAASPAPPPEIQEPLQAGQFYPADQAELRALVRGFLDQARAPKLDGRLVGLMSPHAGLVYSGPVAAYAYQALAGSGVKRVVIMGPSHRTALEGVFVLDQDGYRTPLGVVKLDRKGARKLIGARPWIGSGPGLYTDEHSLEVQLPFLQETLGPDLEVVMVMIGTIGADQCAELARVLNEVFPGPDTVYIASTDMSHGNYPPYQNSDQIRPVDLATLALIQTLDPDQAGPGLMNGSAPLCGRLPVLTLLSLVKARGADRAEVLHYADSGDATGNHQGVVGYGAVAFIDGKTENEGAGMERKEISKDPAGGFQLSDEEKLELLKMARACASAAVKGEPVPRFDTESANLQRTGAAFVTLKNQGRLRGCIGTIFANEPLYQCIQSRAVDAAVNDARFFGNRVTPAELGAIEIEISVLTPPVAATPAEIVVGRDGVFLTVGYNRGVFLPQVPVEQGWDHDAYLDNLCHKAGSGDPNCWRRPDAKLERFEAIVFSEHEMGL